MNRLQDRVFITRTEPEVALVLWQVRDFPATRLIRDDPHYVCDHCNKRLDWEPFPVIVLPSREELKDPDYVPIGIPSAGRAPGSATTSPRKMSARLTGCGSAMTVPGTRPD